MMPGGHNSRQFFEPRLKAPDAKWLLWIHAEQVRSAADAAPWSARASAFASTIAPRAGSCWTGTPTSRSTSRIGSGRAVGEG